MSKLLILLMSLMPLTTSAANHYACDSKYLENELKSNYGLQTIDSINDTINELDGYISCLVRVNPVRYPPSGQAYVDISTIQSIIVHTNTDTEDFWIHTH